MIDLFEQFLESSRGSIILLNNSDQVARALTHLIEIWGPSATTAGFNAVRAKRVKRCGSESGWREHRS